MTQGEIHRRFAAGEIDSAEAARLTMELLRPSRGLRARIAVWVVGLTALVVLAACPPRPGPAPVNPTPDADAATPPPNCAVACNHYGIVCAGALAVCDQTCPGAEALDTGYTICLAGATACMNCDATARAAAKPRGK